MNIQDKEQYMETLRERYLASGKKEKGLILDEFLDKSGAEEAYRLINSKLEQEGKTLSMKSPYRIRDSILHNLNIGLNKY